MEYNASARKRNSKVIIDKNTNLTQDDNNFQNQLKDAIKKVNEEGQEDVSNRQNLIENIHLYVDCFNEMRYLGHYRWNNNSAVLFITSIGNISLKQYLAGWNDYYDYDIILEDVVYLWAIFFPYFPLRDNSKVIASTMWDNTDARAENLQKAIPTTPPTREFQDSIVVMGEKTYVVAKDVLEESQKAKDVILDGDKSKQEDYELIEDKEQFKITPSGQKVSYSSFNGNASFGYKTYTILAYDKKKTEEYAKKLINEKFKTGSIHFFCSENHETFGFGKVIERHVKVDRIELKSEYKNAKPSEASEDFQETCYESSDKYWECEYSASITFEFTYINGSDEINLCTDMDDDFAVDVLKTYHSNLLSLLTVAYENLQKAYENVKVEDNGKYDEYLKYLQEAEYDNLKNVVIINNTVVNSVKTWVEARIKELFNAIQDEVAAETVKSIISERMNKHYGTLFSWHVNDTFGIAQFYEMNKQKVKDSLYVFKMMLVSEVLSLDYTLEQNGGEEPINPSFIDIEKDRYPYYKLAGVSTDFKTGDEVYLVDDNNPEFKAKITETKEWTAMYNNEEIKVKRIILDSTVSSVYEKATLRIIKLL